MLRNHKSRLLGAPLGEVPLEEAENMGYAGVEMLGTDLGEFPGSEK